MKRSQWYISTIDENAQTLATEHGLGLEIAEYCTAYNMDDYFEETDASVMKKLEGIESRVLHAPFNELFPCAIDRKVRALAAERYRHAISLAQRYGAKKVVIHGGHNPWLYYPVWYVGQSIEFWNEFVKEIPDGIEVCLENVLETDPEWLLEIVSTVNHPRLKMCLDVGHVNAYSEIPVAEWLKQYSPYISHFHIHNNGGDADTHQSFDKGSMDMRQLLELADELCPEATYTIEIVDSEASVGWLMDSGLIDGE